MPKIKVKGQKVQTGERPQTNGWTQHVCYLTYYLPCYVVDNEHDAQNRHTTGMSFLWRWRRVVSLGIFTAVLHHSRQQWLASRRRRNAGALLSGVRTSNACPSWSCTRWRTSYTQQTTRSPTAQFSTTASTYIGRLITCILEIIILKYYTTYSSTRIT